MLKVCKKLNIERLLNLDLRYSSLSKEEKSEALLCNKPGVYLIINKITKEFYIGSSKNILRRLKEHIKRPKGILKESFVLYDRLKDFEYILPVQSYKDILFVLKNCKLHLVNDNIVKYILWLELNGINNSINKRNKSRINKTRSIKNKRKFWLKYNRIGIYKGNNNYWYKNLEALYINIYKPSLNIRKIIL